MREGPWNDGWDGNKVLTLSASFKRRLLSLSLYGRMLRDGQCVQVAARCGLGTAALNESERGLGATLLMKRIVMMRGTGCKRAKAWESSNY